MDFDASRYRQAVKIPETKFSKKDLGHIYRCLEDQRPPIKLTKYLGSGEQGTAFLDEGGQVTKVSKLSGEDGPHALEVWTNEVVEGKKLGEIEPKIAPKIYRYATCDNSTEFFFDKLGIIQMETLVMADKGATEGPDKDHGPIRVKSEDDKQDFLNRMTLSHQYGFIKKFLVLGKHGYIHMDNHIENLGYVKVGHGQGLMYEPILFDFGFLQKFEPTRENVLFALAFSCFILLEHNDLATIEETLFLRIGIACLFGTPDQVDSIFNLDTLPDTEFVKLVKSTEHFNLRFIRASFHFEQSYSKEIHEINSILQKVFHDTHEDSDPNLNIKFGALCSLYILPLDRDERYETKIYELFYHIRANTFTFAEVSERGHWNEKLVPVSEELRSVIGSERSSPRSKRSRSAEAHESADSSRSKSLSRSKSSRSKGSAQELLREDQEKTVAKLEEIKKLQDYGVEHLSPFAQYKIKKLTNFDKQLFVELYQKHRAEIKRKRERD